MNITAKKFIAPLSVALLGVGCATTSDPYACADQGVFAVGCHGNVAGENERRKRELDDTQQSTVEITRTLEEKRATEAALQSRVAALKSKLQGQRTELATLQTDLDAQRDANQLTQQRYDELSAELATINDKIDYYENLENLAYSEDTADNLENLLEAETFAIKQKIVEGSLGG